MSYTVQIVWFKRDLRVRDHRPLTAAAQRGPVLPLYVAEPSIIGAPDFAPRHWTLIRRWVPELRGITHAASVHAPWTMPPIEQHAAGCVVGRDYPERIVDHNKAYHHAHDRIRALRNRPEIEAKKAEILEQHGSRR